VRPYDPFQCYPLQINVCAFHIYSMRAARPRLLIVLDVVTLNTFGVSKSIKIKAFRTVILPVVLYGCQTWYLTLRKVGLGCS
jgi:hypothetical protein